MTYDGDIEASDIVTSSALGPACPRSSLAMSALDTGGLVLQLLVSLSLAQEQPWSPIVGGRGLSANQRPASSHNGPIRHLSFPPLLPTSNLIVHSPLPSLRTVTSDNSLPSSWLMVCGDAGSSNHMVRPQGICCKVLLFTPVWFLRANTQHPPPGRGRGRGMLV